MHDEKDRSVLIKKSNIMINLITKCNSIGDVFINTTLVIIHVASVRLCCGNDGNERSCGFPVGYLESGLAGISCIFSY